MARNPLQLERAMDGDQENSAVLVKHALSQLREIYEHSGKLERFEGLREFIAAGHRPGAIASAAALLGLSESAAQGEIHRMHQMFADLLRAELSSRTASAAQVEVELTQLLERIQRG